MRIRELDVTDWKLWRDMRVAALADSPDAFGRTVDEERLTSDAVWRERIAEPDGLHLAAEDQGRVVGIAVSRIDHEDPSVAGVFAMWVDPSSRRRGVGRALLEYAVAWAQGRGARTVELSVTEHNTAAHDMYAAAGFVPTGKREPLRPGSTLSILYMRREIGI